MVNPIRSATVLLLAATTIVAAPPPPRIGGGPLASMHGPAVSPRNNFGPEIRRSYNSNHDQDIWIHDVSLTSGGGDPVEAATAYARSRLTSSDFVVKSAYTSDLSGATHIYLRQKVNGLEVVNGNLNMNVDKHGRLVSYGDSFVAPNAQQQRKYASSFLKKVENGWHVVSSSFSQIFFNAEKQQQQQQRYKFAQAREPVIEPSDAILSLLAFVQPGPVDPALWTSVASLKQQDDDDNSPMVAFDNVPHALSPVTARQAYIQTEGGELLLVWDIEIEMRDHWYSAYVNAHDGTVVGLVDWVADASDVYYNVIPFGFNDPSDTLQQMVYNPYDAFASPEGWHAQSTVSGHIQNFNVTVGNNVYAHTNPDGGYSWEDNYRPMGKLSDEGDLYFDYVADFERQEPNEYEDAAVTNLFYWCNIAHDLFYRYGFDEKAGNFQQDNLGRGRTNDDGANDAVIANAQDGSGRNNANFATPPDGRHGKMRMYVWDETSPMRDGDFESGIVIHEYTHGVSNRLTNGPHDSNCLGWGEAGGMGEGWGDFVATIIRMNENDTRESEFGMGGWANGDDAGIRKYKYSTSMKTNPSTYKIMDRFDYWGVHAKGEVWAVMLYEIYWNLVDAYGFTPEWFPPLPSIDGDLTAAKKHILSHGNTLALQLVIDGMKLQPCNPSFVDARDAILDADKLLTEGANYCLIYAGFAKRGLGVGAKLVKEGWLEHREESFDVPEECQ